MVDWLNGHFIEQNDIIIIDDDIIDIDRMCLLQLTASTFCF